MNGLDLFSGIGGITKALEGYVRPVAYCENDRYAQAVLLCRVRDEHIPCAPIWDDVRTLRGSLLPEKPEIIYGGPPCQPWSSAGKRIGKTDERNMWPEALRLVEELRPAHCFFENVDELAADSYFIEIVERLETLGYFVPWPIILAASDVGAPHQRDRLWIAAHLAGEPMGTSRQPWVHGGMGEATDASRDGVQGKPISAKRRCQNSDPDRGYQMADSESIRWSEGRPKPAGIEGRYDGPASNLQIADLDTTGLPLFQRRRAPPEARGRTESYSNDWWSVEPGVGRMVHGLPFRMDRIKCLGNAVVPAQAREAFEILMGLK